MFRLSVTTLCIGAVLLISCGKSSPPVTADLAGFDLSQVSGSAYSLATRIHNGDKVQEGYVMNGSKNGIWIDYGEDGRISMIQHYIEGKLNGPAITFDNRGQVTALANYTDGVYDGLKAAYKFGRPQEEIPYKMGKIHGVMKKYDSSNRLTEEIEYKNNLQDGYYRHYNEEGAIDLEYLYKNGEKVSGGIVVPEKKEEQN